MNEARLHRELRVWREFLKQFAEETATKAREALDELRTRYHLIRLREELRDAYARLGQVFFESLEQEEGARNEDIEKLIKEIYEYRELIQDLENIIRR